MVSFANTKEAKGFEKDAIFSFSECFSNFGQSWIRPLVWYIFIGLIFTIFVCIFSDTKDTKYLDVFVNALNPIDRETIKNYHIFGLIYKVFSGLLIYQIVIALKRQTKR
jgi:hypothetical protein